MGRNRPKAGAGAVEAQRYDIFGNPMPQAQSQNVYTADLKNASLEELQKMRREIDAVFEPAMRDWEYAQEQALYTIMETAPTIEDVAVGDLFRAISGYDQRQGNIERSRILNALGEGIPPEQIIPYKVTRDPDMTDQEFLDSKIGKRYVERLRQLQPQLMEAYGRFIGLNNRYQAIQDAIDEILRNPKPEPKPKAGSERAAQAINETIIAITALVDPTLQSRDPKEAMKKIKADDLKSFTDSQLKSVNDQVRYALEDVIAPAITQILLGSSAGTYGANIPSSSSRLKMRQLMRGVDAVAQLDSKIQREGLRRTAGETGAPTQAQVELNVIPGYRRQMIGLVENEIRQRKRRGDYVPDWATDNASIARIVDRTLNFDPIQARNT